MSCGRVSTASGNYGLLANTTRKANITRIRTLLCVQQSKQPAVPEPQAEIAPLTLREPCPCCGSPMRIVEIFRRGQKPSSRSTAEGAGRMTNRLSLVTENQPAAIRRLGPNSLCLFTSKRRTKRQ